MSAETTSPPLSPPLVPAFLVSGFLFSVVVCSMGYRYVRRQSILASPDPNVQRILEERRARYGDLIGQSVNLVVPKMWDVRISTGTEEEKMEWAELNPLAASLIPNTDSPSHTNNPNNPPPAMNLWRSMSSIAPLPPNSKDSSSPDPSPSSDLHITFAILMPSPPPSPSHNHYPPLSDLKLDLGTVRVPWTSTDPLS
ncbi:hypothetical protein SISSUDRAFT_1130234 [Sistotremastrum suecicum HHB10207 ss-3]|uniref:Uncharacterized protein n=1 Tax=Sistotremastrum suecicum HHB10207 ss-3 TaxID=1314776 RepID=A0A166BNN5_9AGAM|nr:hypothetical protein SISSUDRAFT_1130234 [Sistotremastrum suecicum HHB10207 ss-3]